jgi:excisionase family DNA binding protein
MNTDEDAFININRAYTTDEACKIASIGKTMLYAEIKAKRLKVRKCGVRTLILAQELGRWLQSLPEA